MTIEEARALIRGVEWRGSRPGLSRVRELLHRIGDPQDTLQFVHIAGTNGKGSTAAMLAAVLQAAGYTTGLFTSPFLEQFAERMQVNGQLIPDAELAAACETLQPCIAAMDDQPTEFELVTAAAMLWFQRRGCDIVVLEVGLGGRLDATNVIGAPACAVITNIGLDHTEILGDTLAQIAREKAGILKPGTRAVSYPQAQEVSYSPDHFAGAMEEAGLRTGTQTQTLTLIVNEENSYKVSMASRIASQLSQYDLRVTVRTMSWSSYTQALRSGNYDLYYAECRLTADWDLTPLLAAGGALNYGGAASDEMTAALTRWLTCTQDEQTEAMDSLCQVFREQSPILPVCFKRTSVLMTQGAVETITPTAANPFYGLKDWKINFKK